MCKKKLSCRTKVEKKNEKKVNMDIIEYNLPIPPEKL